LSLSFLQQINIAQLIKYGLISVVGYATILGLMYVFVDIAKIDKSVSFFFVYLIAYLAEYVLNLKYLFHKTHSLGKVLKFALHIAFFLVSGTFIFKLLLGYGLHYFVATLATAISLMPLRFLAHKFLVFR
jgi:putative flippase GtrA